ncbi:MAG: MerR family DNA-binding transcriptional regulator, partial [Planctomycetaceae bacterium]
MTGSPADSMPPNSPCLQGEHVTFTGTLASMTHRQASILAEEHGGTAAHHVSGLTTMLVIGEEGWPLEIDGQPSRKLVQVRCLEEQGQSVRVLTESEWLHLIGLNQGRHDVQRNYTPAMLSRLLGVPVNQIRSWERHGLIRPVRRVYRLP